MQDVQLNVLQIVGNLDIGGAQEVVRTLAEYLTENGCRVVVCTFKDGPLRQEIERLGVPVEVLPQRRYSVVALPFFVIDMLRIRRALVGIVKKHRINVVQTHLLRVLDFLVLTLRWRKNPPLVFWTVHNYNFALRVDQLPRYKWLLGPKRFMYRLLYRLATPWVSGFIAVSDEVKTAILQAIGPVQDKVTVICNGVDVRRYGRAVNKSEIRRQLGLTESVRLMAMVGTLKEQKGHRYLIEATAIVIRSFPNLHLLLVGDGNLKEELQAQTRALGLDGHIHFVGSRNDVPDLLAASDYFVLPSLWEGLPMALIEAMASRLPIVATAVSGTKQVVIAGETGLLVPPGNVQQLTEAMTCLLTESSWAQTMAAAAQRRVAIFFSAKRQAEQHIALYHQEWAKRSGYAT